MRDNEGLIFIGIVWLIVGVVCLLGAIKKWKFLVDPPEKYWFFYSPSWGKKLYGKEALIPLNYFFGIVSILGGAFFLFKGVKNIFY